MANQIVVSSGAKVRDLNDVIIGTSGVLSSLAFNVSNGVPKLDVNGKILVSQLPNSVMEYLGTWNAATNTPFLVNGTGNAGDVYLCNVAGTVDFGAGPISFAVGDQVIYSGSIWQRASGASGTVTSVAVTESGDSLNITGSPITTSGTINIGFNGTNLQYINGAGDLTTFPSLTGYVPYTGATTNVNLGTFDLTADIITGATGSFASSGGSNTFDINHSSGSGIALNITKGGNEEGIYINKTSGSGNAATIIGTLNATTLVKSGGTSTQFLKADGSVDSSTYLTTSAASSTYVPYTGATASVNIGNNLLSSASIQLNGDNTSNFGYLGFKQYAGGTSGFNGYTSIFAQGTNSINIAFSATGGSKTISFLSDLISSSTTRSYSLPDADGTIALTSSLSSYLPLAGGTLTGALNGTSAVFSSTVQASAYRLTGMTGGSGALYWSSDRVTLANYNATGVVNIEANGGTSVATFGGATYNNDFVGTLRNTTSAYFATTSGTVGIGISAPVGKLQIYKNGLSAVIGKMSDANILIDSGDYGVNTYTSQIAFGYYSGTFTYAPVAIGFITTSGSSAGRGDLTFNTRDTTTDVAPTERMRITSAGNVGIGTSSPANKLEVSGTIRSTTQTDPTSGTGIELFYRGADSASYIQSYDRTNSAWKDIRMFGNTLIFGTSDTERMRITSGGDVFVGFSGSAPGQRLRTQGADSSNVNYSLVVANSTTASTFLVRNDGLIQTGTQSGSPYNNTSGAAANLVVNSAGTLERSTSSLKYKKDVKDYDKGLTEVMAMRPVYYKGISESDGDKQFAGLIAEEIDALGLNEFVTYAEDGSPDALAYQNMIALLTKAIQEQQAQIEELKALINK